MSDDFRHCDDDRHKVVNRAVFTAVPDLAPHTFQEISIGPAAWSALSQSTMVQPKLQIKINSGYKKGELGSQSCKTSLVNDNPVHTSASTAQLTSQWILSQLSHSPSPHLISTWDSNSSRPRSKPTALTPPHLCRSTPTVQVGTMAVTA